ncbi:hypothetical protein D1872_176020 [compost metagenome]
MGQDRKITRKHFVGHQRQAPAIHHDMMEAPYKTVRILTCAQNSHTHQSILCQIKASLLVFTRIFEDVLVLLLLLHIPQILYIQFAALIPIHDLKRFIFPATVKVRAQYRMPLHQYIQTGRKCSDIKLSSQIKGCLFKIRSRLRIHQIVKEHPLLHRRQCVHIFQLTDTCCLFRDLFQFLSRQTFEGHITWRQFRMLLSGTMRNDLLQSRLQQSRHTFQRFLAILLTAVSNRQAQRAFRDHRV